jgi:hypothetical protein
MAMLVPDALEAEIASFFWAVTGTAVINPRTLVTMTVRVQLRIKPSSFVAAQLSNWRASGAV